MTKLSRPGPRSPRKTEEAQLTDEISAWYNEMARAEKALADLFDNRYEMRQAKIVSIQGYRTAITLIAEAQVAINLAQKEMAVRYAQIDRLQKETRQVVTVRPIGSQKANSRAS